MEPHPALDQEAPGAGWYGRVASRDDLAACMASLGLLPLQAPPPWPSLPAMLAPGVSLTAAWAWAGTLVDEQALYSGRLLRGLPTGCLGTLPLFALACARGPGADPGLAYARGAYGITAKAVVELLLRRGPLTVQQIRLGLGQHKRFLIHDTPQVLAELEAALMIVPVGPDYVRAAQPRAGVGTLTPRPRSRFIPPPNPAVALRAWELTLRWAPPAVLATADRLREHPGEARLLLRRHLAALAPTATPAEQDALLGEDPPDEPATTPDP